MHIREETGPVSNAGWDNVADADDISAAMTRGDEIDTKRTTERSVNLN